MNTGASVREIVVISLEAWDDVWRRNQYLMDGLLARDPHLRVLFVEPPHDLTHRLVRGGGIARGRGRRVPSEYGGRLTLFQPTKILPRALGRTADTSWRRQVLREVEGLGMRRPLVWVNDAQGAEIVAVTDWPSIYDITDDWLAAPRAPRVLRRLERNERTLMARCTEVFVCSAGLAASRGRDRSVRIIPNAVDVRRYRISAPLPDDLPSNAVVYAGTLHEDRLDVDLVARSARRLGAEGSLLLIGPDALTEESRRVLRAAGVLLLGSRPRDRIPAYLQHAAVLIVPHVVDRFTDSLDPIKLYEYLAVGRPVVSTAVAGFRDRTVDFVEVAPADEFPARVLGALRRREPTRSDAAVPDWATRVDAVREVLADIGVGDTGSSTERG